MDEGRESGHNYTVIVYRGGRNGSAGKRPSDLCHFLQACDII